MGAINVSSSGSRSGIIHLNAQNGTLTLPTGTLNANGATNQGAGQIILLANTLTTVSGTKISATQTAAAAATNHGVAIAANTINVAGANGLQVLGNGNGPSAGTAYAALLPKGGVSFSSTNSFTNLFWTTSTFSLSTNGPMVVSGLGAPITVSANGTNSQVTVSGYPINFNNGAVTITAKGSTANSHRIVMQYVGSFSGTNGLTFSGNGAVTLDSSGTSGNNAAGEIYVLVDHASVLSTVPTFTMNANGLGSGSGALINFQPTKIPTLASPAVNISANGANGHINFGPWTGTAAGDASITSAAFNLNANARASGTGNAGSIYFGTGNLTVGGSTKMKFSSVGPTTGNGNGGSITAFPGNVAGGTLKLGTSVGSLQVLANAGSTGGDGGVLNINPFPGSISIETADAISAAASIGGTANSKGGSVTLIGNPNVQVASSVTGATINVDGKGTRDGGMIRILGNGTLNLGTTPGALNMSANATGTGKGGSIEIAYTTAINQTGGVLSASAGPGVGSNGLGGIINIHDIGSGTFAGQLKVDGFGTGKGGSLSLHSGAFNTMNLNGATLSAIGDIAGTGDGGSVTVDNQGSITVSGTSFFARGGQNSTGGNGGQITISTQGSPIDISTATFINAIASPNSSKQGGSVTINKAQGPGGTAAIDFVPVISVASGDTAGVSVPGGTIVLNLVTCTRTNTGYATAWPKYYYRCTAPNDTWDEIPALEGKSDGLIHSLIGASTNILVFSSQSAMETFFAKTFPVDFAGATFKNSGGLYTYVNVLVAQLSLESHAHEVSQHELGHAMEFAYGAANESLHSDFEKFKKNDFLNLDYLPESTTRRDPCSVTPNNSLPPYAGVIDAAGVSICGTGTGYTIIPGTTMGILNKFIPGGVLMTNSKIAMLESNYTFTSNKELYAQEFAVFRYADSSIPSSDLYDKTANGLFHQNYFVCTVNWVINAYLNQPRSSNAPGYCSLTPPGWYVPGQ